jgi:hypothetical protein
MRIITIIHLVYRGVGMSDLVNQAMRFAKETHQRIDQRRKYSDQPYSVHLEQVAKIVATVTDDQEMIASAWLHDVVEDTPATLDDIEHDFGVSIAQLVRELTDISKPTDGNRETRKAIDREHLANASGRAQTVKLADLIDNCKDITRQDARFARVYLNEMEALLSVLTKADERLMRRAHRTMAEGAAYIEKSPANAKDAGNRPSEDTDLDAHFKRQYNDIFTARDIANPLLSFDAHTPVAQVEESLTKHRRHLATVRMNGEVAGFIVQDRLGAEGHCGRFSQAFSPDQVLSGEAGFAEVIHVLTRHSYCFISMLGQIQGVISREDVNKPYMRMWLFGIVTLTEMRITELVKRHFRGDAWHHLIPEARLQAAQNLQLERKRLNQHVELIDCLQMADKGLLLINQPELLSEFGFSSKRAAKTVLKHFQSLRNNLAHAQDISTYDWAQIARISMRMLE